MHAKWKLHSNQRIIFENVRWAMLHRKSLYALTSQQQSPAEILYACENAEIETTVIVEVSVGCCVAAIVKLLMIFKACVSVVRTGGQSKLRPSPPPPELEI